MNSIRFWLLTCLVWAAFLVPNFSALAQDISAPLVFIWSTVPETLEPSGHTEVTPGVFEITRLGNTNEELILFVEFSGTATFGQDYHEASQYLIMPAGATKLSFFVEPLDDAAVEGNEAVIATLAAHPPTNSLPNYGVHFRLNHATVVVHDNDFPNDRPVVSLSAPSAVLEFCPPNADCVGLEFQLRRTAPGLDQPLTIFLLYEGTATADVDYRTLRQLTFEAGRDSATAFSSPIDDTLFEGDETIIVSIGEGPGYYIDPNRRQTTTVIRDDDLPAPPVVSLQPVQSDAAETVNFQEPIWGEFSVQRTGPTTNDLLVYLDMREGVAVFNEDYTLDGVGAGGILRIPAGYAGIGVRLWPIDDPLVEGRESAVVKLLPAPFANPLAYSIDAAHASVEIRIFDNEPSLPVVSLSANSSWRTGEPCPVCFVAPGVLTVSRTGSTTSPLSIFLSYDGTATAGVDYQALPLVVTLPAGASSGQLLVWGIDDLLAGGPEVLRARLQPMVTAGGYRVNEQANEALVVIGDDEPGAPSLRLDLVEPHPGARFAAGVIVKLSALGVWTEGELDHAVEFIADGTVIGRSDPPSLDRATIPGLPSVHTSFWTNPPPGGHSLTARFEATTTLAVTSPPVQITVAVGNNALPYVAILRPRFGAFPTGAPGAPVNIVVETRDPDGHVPQVSFFAEGRKIGEVNVQFVREPEPGQSEEVTFVWNNPPSGRHALTTQAKDNRGGVGTSAAVLFEISALPLPVVTVAARDASAVEPEGSTNLNTATFRIRRSGPTNQPLVVAYSLGGTAENGTDYESLGGTATIQAGRRSALVTLRPWADALQEGLETMILRLQTNAAGNYAIGQPSVAIAIINDGPQSPTPRCAVLPGGLIHVSFAADPPQNFRLEASRDLGRWEIICDAVSSDGTWHFVDDELDLHPHRFYRLTPEPTVEADE